MKIFLIFPVHLFKDIIDYKDVDEIFLVEEPLYFTKYKFHKLKLAFHRATMKNYEDYLHDKKFKVKYFEFNDDYMIKLKGHEVSFYDPVDHDLMKKIRLGSKKYNFKIDLLETQTFITSYEDLEEYNKKVSNNKKFTHDSSFYRWQRQRLEILTPIGNSGKTYKLSYDDGEQDFEFWKSYDFTPLKDTYVKVIVVNKQNPYLFDNVIDTLYKSGVSDISIVEDFTDTVIENDQELIDQAEDTMTILSKYIDNLTLNVESEKLKSLMRELYIEALNTETTE